MNGYTAEELAVVWVSALGGFEPRTAVFLLRKAGDPARLFDDRFPLPAPVPDGKAKRKAAENFLATLAEDAFAVTLVSEDYPELLKQIPDPPLVLYGAGNRALLKEDKFCIVGSRVTPPWAETCTKQIAREITRRYCVVTGLAEGGDSAAIGGALESGKLICVLPCGIERCYPAAHTSLKERVRKKGLILSEYLPGESAAKYSFYARNRLLAGLSEGVLVVSAGKRSGTLLTAGYAAEYGRDVYAFPHNLGAAQGVGCNSLLRDGAFVCTCAADICAELAQTEKTAPMPELEGAESNVFALLREMGEAHAAVIAERAGMQIYEVSAALSALEVKGLAVKSGGNRYAAVSLK